MSCAISCENNFSTSSSVKWRYTQYNDDKKTATTLHKWNYSKHQAKRTVKTVYSLISYSIICYFYLCFFPSHYFNNFVFIKVSWDVRKTRISLYLNMYNRRISCTFLLTEKKLNNFYCWWLPISWLLRLPVSEWV